MGRVRQHGRVGLSYQLFLETQAPGNHYLAILRKRLADGVQRLLDRGVDEAAGIDDDEIGAGVVGRGEIALGPELGEDAFGIYECLRAA